MKTLLALYADHTRAEEAVQALVKAGHGHDAIELHSSATIKDRTVTPLINPAGAAVPGTASPPAGLGTASGSPSAAGMPVQEVSGVEGIRSYLERLGITGDEGLFYAKGIQGGGHLLRLDVNDAEADGASGILERTGGRAPTAR